MTVTPENVRFHAAGHLAAAILLCNAGNADAAKVVLAPLNDYVTDARVIAPEALVEKVAEVTVRPNTSDLTMLEQWFVDPLNTKFERGEA